MGKSRERDREIINSVAIPDTWVCEVEVYVSLQVPVDAGYQTNAPRHLELYNLTPEAQRGLMALTYGTWNMQQTVNGKPVRSHADSIKSLLERIGRSIA